MTQLLIVFASIYRPQHNSNHIIDKSSSGKHINHSTLQQCNTFVLSIIVSSLDPVPYSPLDVHTSFGIITLRPHTHFLINCSRTTYNYRLWNSFSLSIQLQTLEFISFCLIQLQTMAHTHASCPLELQTLKICFLPCRVTEFGKHPCTRPFRVTDVAHLLIFLYRVTDSGIHLFRHVELHTLDVYLSILQGYRLWIYLILPYRIIDLGKHLFLPCRVINSDSIFGSDHVFTIQTLALSSIWINTTHWLIPHSYFSSNLFLLLETKSNISFFFALVPRTTEL